MTLDVTIVELPAKHLTGMKIQTDMQKAAADCSALWQTFGPKMNSIPAQQGKGEGYGLSIIIQDQESGHCNDFEYWAAVETLPDAALPEGMQSVTLPAGQYAKCTAPSLEKLGDAYNYLYGDWIATQSTFTLNVQAPCFEVYPADWQATMPLDLYVPLNAQELGEEKKEASVYPRPPMEML